MNDPSRRMPADADRLAVDLDDLERQLRALSAKKQMSSDDPLAELARIVEREDPLRALLAEEARPRATAGPDHPMAIRAPARVPQAEPVAAPPRSYEHQPQASQRYAPQAYAQQAEPDWQDELRGGLGTQPDTRAAPDMAQAHFQPVYTHDAVYDGSVAGQQAYADDGLYEVDPAYAEAPPMEEGQDFVPLTPRRSRKGLYTVVALFGVACASLAGVLMLRSGEPQAPSGEPPLIEAQNGPARVQPENPGGVVIPNQDKQIYERLGQNQPPPSQIVNRTEQPVDIRALARDQQGSAQVGAPATNPAALASGNTALAALGEPRRVRTVAVKPDGTIIAGEPSSAPPPAPVVPAPQPVAQPVIPAPAPAAPVAAPQAANGTPAPASTPAPSTSNGSTGAGSTTASAAAPRPAAPPPLSISPSAPPRSAAPTPRIIAEAAPAQPPVQSPAPARPTPAPQQVAAATTGGDYMVQLAAPGSEAEARSTFATLQRRFPGDLSGYQPVIRQAEVGGRSIYRLRVGSMSREDANSLCSRLQASGGQCFVARGN